tara:strand:+ start:835 stop:1578 length:744 start_codon:yes stop_codon:yes gene_type:complete
MEKKKNDYSGGRTPAIWCVIPQRAVVDKRLQRRPKTFMMLCALGNYTNRYGTCYPNQLTLARDCNVTQQTVSYHIKLLMEYGYIAYAKKHKSLKGNKYFMIFDPNNAVEQEEARAMQKTEHVEAIEEPITIVQGHKTMDDKKPSKTAKNIMADFKKIVMELYGQNIIWKPDHETLVQEWLDSGHKKEYILNRVRNILEYRIKNNMDSVKSIIYFKNIFSKQKPAEKTDKETLDGLIKKFTNTHKMKW